MNTENNKLLAEFLGWETNDDSTVELPDNLANHWQGESRKEDCLQFHNDYNWLMLVVERIEKTNLGTLEIQSKNLVLISYNGKRIQHFNSDLIGNVYNACIEFVKWWNQNK